MTASLAGRSAFVTGGTRGIGAAIVRRLAREGAAVTFVYRSAQAAAQALVAEIEAAGGRAHAIQADVADAAALTAAVRQAAHRMGGVDVLVHNAGIGMPALVQHARLDDFDRVMAVNVRAAFVAVQAALPHMPDGGRIVHIGSCYGERLPFVGLAAYAASKSALQGLTKALARHLGARRITVNNVQPGPTDTDMNPRGGPHAAAFHRLMALPRHGEPQEVAALVAWLAGPEAGFVTGTSITIDGGFAA